MNNTELVETIIGSIQNESISDNPRPIRIVLKDHDRVDLLSSRIWVRLFGTYTYEAKGIYSQLCLEIRRELGVDLAIHIGTHALGLDSYCRLTTEGPTVLFVE